MITFVTPTALPIEAATTMGVSVKEDGAIGKFGTGMKYAIAGILRLNGQIEIVVDGERFEFTAKETDIRGKVFRIVHCNGNACGFTTELGKHWEPWQLLRELASNAIDEGGHWTHDGTASPDARTIIRVSCREVEEAERRENVFLGEKLILVNSSNGATIHAGPSQHYYFRGIRAGSFDSDAPVTINVHDGALSEDRLLDRSTVEREMSWAFITATQWDRDFVSSVLRSKEDNDFWVRHLNLYQISGAELPADLMGFLADRPKGVLHPAFRKALRRHQERSGGGTWSDIELDSRHIQLISAGERLCVAIGIDPIPRDKVHFTRDLGDEQLAVTSMDTRDVWFSTNLVLRGRDEFLSGYLEEALHAMTGLRDCTREFQNALLSIIVSNTRQDYLQEAA